MEEARTEDRLEILSTSLSQNMHFPRTCFRLEKVNAALGWKLG
jgi:hypothetical protein